MDNVAEVDSFVLEADRERFEPEADPDFEPIPEGHFAVDQEVTVTMECEMDDHAAGNLLALMPPWYFLRFVMCPPADFFLVMRRFKLKNHWLHFYDAAPPHLNRPGATLV